MKPPKYMPDFRSVDGGPGDDQPATIRVRPGDDPADRWATRYVLTDGLGFPWHPLTGREFAHLHYLTHHAVAGWPVQSAESFAAVLAGCPLPTLAVDPPVADALLARALAAGRRAYRDVVKRSFTDMIPDRIARAVVAEVHLFMEEL